MSLLHPELGEVDVDEGLAPLIREMWIAGVRTVDCCEDVAESLAELAVHLPHLLDRKSGHAQIGLASALDVCVFFEALANVGPRDDFYVRMVHWAAPDAWELGVAVCDVAVEDAAEDEVTPGVSVFEMVASVALSFPCGDIPEMLRRMCDHNAGRRAPPGEVDFSSIEVDVDDD